MTEFVEPATTKTVAQVEKRAAQRAFIAALVVTLACAFSPPFLRIIGSKAWISLGLTEAQWSVFIATRSLFFILFILTAGILADFLGRRRVFLYALAGFIVCTFLLLILGPGNSFGFIYLTLSVISIMIKTITITLIILLFVGRKRILPVFIYSGFSVLASVFSPLLAKAIGQNAGVKAIFILPLLIGIVGFVLSLKYIPESRASGDLNRKNVIALAIWTFGLCMVIFAAVLAIGLRWTHPLVFVCVSIGIILMLTLKWLDGIRLPENLRFRLLLSRRLNIAILTGIIHSITMMAIVNQMLNFFTEVQGINVLVAALGLSPILVGAIFLSGLAARLTLRLGLARALSASLVLAALPPAIFSMLSPNISYWVLLPFLLLVGFGFILGNSPRLLLLFSSVPQGLSATVQAIGSATSQLGGGLAYSFMLTLMESYFWRAYIDQLQAHGLTYAQITSRLLSIVEASNELALILPGEQPSEVRQQIELLLHQAYVSGLSFAMLALAGVCLLSAAIVYLSLRNSKTVESLESPEKQMSKTG